MRWPTRAAFTLVELLVVIGIMGVLIGLMLPAVQKVREVANRASCTNNLKQIGLGLHHYHDAHGRLPPGYAATAPYVDGATDTMPGWSWAAYLLPYLEQQGLCEQIDFSQPAGNQSAGQGVLKMFLCPSDMPPDAPFIVADAFGDPVAKAAPSSYAACCGGDESGTADQYGQGLFFRNSQIRFADIKDGLSNTIMIGERSWTNAEGVWAAAYTDGIIQRGPGNVCPGNATNVASALVLAHCHLLNTRTDTDGGLDDFSSQHLGGVNFLFADGSGRFLRDVPADNPDGSYTADSLIFQAMATRAGGEVTPYDY